MSASSVSLHRQTFRKQERLCSRKIIQDLAVNGSNIHANPFRLIWLTKTLTAKVPAQAAFSVPKRNFKNATDRNRIKRLMREAYRKNKYIVYSLIAQKNLQLAILILFTGKEILTCSETEKKVKNILYLLAEEIQNTIH